MIETSGLTKRFDDITAVDHIDAKIKEGSVFGLIGTNGAGKSTFLRMVSGIFTLLSSMSILPREALPVSVAEVLASR